VADVTATEQDVLAANAAFYAAFAAKDMAAMEALWAQRAPVTCLHPGWNLLSGREAVLESWRAILENPQQGRIVAGGATARLLGDAALVVCRELVSGNPLAATNVFILEDGAWRLVHHQSGPVMQLD
jgi:ketosteroid isomerase-like protein